MYIYIYIYICVHMYTHIYTYVEQSVVLSTNINYGRTFVYDSLIPTSYLQIGKRY